MQDALAMQVDDAHAQEPRFLDDEPSPPVDEVTPKPVAEPPDLSDPEPRFVPDAEAQESNAAIDFAKWLFVTTPTSIGRETMNTLKGVPELPEVIQGLGNEITGADGRNIFDFIVDAIEIARHRERDPEWAEQKYRSLMAEFPRIGGYLHEGAETYSDPWETLKTDPARLFVDLFPAASNFAKIRGWTRTAKVLDMADPSNIPANLAAGAVNQASQRFAKDPRAYNPNVTSQYGQDASGALTTERPAVDIAQDITGNIDEVPMAALTDSEFAHIIEEAVRKTEGGNEAAGIRGRDTATRDAIRAKQMQYVDQLASGNVDPNVDFRNPEVAGGVALDDYSEWVGGRRTTLGAQFEKNRTILDTPVQARTMDNLFMKTALEIENQVARDAGTRDRISNPDLQKAVSTFDRLLKNLQAKADDGSLNLGHVYAMRTAYHQRMDLFKRRGQLAETGSGSVANRIYDKFTEDMHDLLLEEIAARPDDFPDNFADTVNLTMREWADLRRLDGSNAANFLRNNQQRPGSIVEMLTRKNPNYTEKFLTDLKTILGDEGWQRLRPALLNRMFEKSLNRGSKTGKDIVTASGLNRVIADINDTNPNRLRQMFGDEMAKNLVEMSNFTKRAFEKRGQWNTPYANRVIQEYLNNPRITEIFTSTYLIGETGQVLMDAIRQSGFQVSQLTPSGLQVGIAAGMWLGLKGRQALLLSDVGRQWMLEGYSVDIRVGNKTVTIDGANLLLAGELIQKHGRTLGKIAHHAQRAKQDKKDDQYIQRNPQPQRRDSEPLMPMLRRSGRNPFMQEVQ